MSLHLTRMVLLPLVLAWFSFGMEPESLSCFSFRQSRSGETTTRTRSARGGSCLTGLILSHRKGAVDGFDGEEQSFGSDDRWMCVTIHSKAANGDIWLFIGQGWWLMLRSPTGNAVGLVNAHGISTEFLRAEARGNRVPEPLQSSRHWGGFWAKRFHASVHDRRNISFT